MTASTTITIRVTVETKERLGHLARETRRSRSFLAAEAVDRYLDQEQAIIEGIKRGRADVTSGHLVPNDKAMAELIAAVEDTGRKQTR